MRQAQHSGVMLTARQVAGFLQVHISTVRRWSDQGILRSYRVGLRRDRRYRQEDVLDFLREEHIARDGEGIFEQDVYRQADRWQEVAPSREKKDGGADEGITH